TNDTPQDPKSGLYPLRSQCRASTARPKCGVTRRTITRRRHPGKSRQTSCAINAWVHAARPVMSALGLKRVALMGWQRDHVLDCRGVAVIFHLHRDCSITLLVDWPLCHGAPLEQHQRSIAALAASFSK